MARATLLDLVALRTDMDCTTWSALRLRQSDPGDGALGVNETRGVDHA